MDFSVPLAPSPTEPATVPALVAETLDAWAPAATDDVVACYCIRFEAPSR